MTYGIIETPDHLHREFQLFAARKLESILDWLDQQVMSDCLQDRHGTFDDHLMLSAILTDQVPARRLNSTREAREFYSKHPEFKPGSKFTTSPTPSTIALANAMEELEIESMAESLEFEIHQEILGYREVAESVESVRVAIRNGTLSGICEEIDSLCELLSEAGFQQIRVYDALVRLEGMIAHGVNNTSLYLESDDDEVYEITELCQGKFREYACQSIDQIRSMNPIEFEHLCAELVAKLGLSKVRLTPAVSDGGADIIAFQYVDGESIKFIIQCKRYASTNKIGVQAVREMVGVSQDLKADHAILITTSEATKPARDFSIRSRSEVQVVRIVDNHLLLRLLKSAISR